MTVGTVRRGRGRRRRWWHSVLLLLLGRWRLRLLLLLGRHLAHFGEHLLLLVQLLLLGLGL